MKELDSSADKGLEWLIAQQNDDGSFKTIERGQPAITAFCVMVFLAQGENPTDGKYRANVKRAIDYIADQQKPNGLLARIDPRSVPITRDLDEASKSDTATSKLESNPTAIVTTALYNHAISALALCEAYGQCDAEQTKKIGPVIEKAIAATLEMQKWIRARDIDVGGWSYLSTISPLDAELSVTGWQLMFLRSARNAGFEVPEHSIEAAVQYVERCFLKQIDRQVHSYEAVNPSTVTRAVAGAGILAMMKTIEHWTLSNDGKMISRKVVTKNFAKAMALLNQVGDVAESENHHPDLHLTGYRNIRIDLTTHTIGVLSEKDFIVAAKIDELIDQN